MIMRASSTNASLSSNSCCKPNGRTYPSSNKPPIPPKPLLPSHYCAIPNTKQKLGNVSSDGQVTQSYFPPSRYPVYPTAVLIKDEDIPYVGSNADFDCKHTLETLTSLSSVSCNETKYNGSFSSLPQMTLEGVLPPLTKVELTPTKYSLSEGNHPHVFELKNNIKSGGRTLNATAKNALLMEKIGGSVTNFHNGSKEILPRANSDPETSSSLSVTVNRSCIISVNSYNNSFMNNNNNFNNNNNEEEEKVNGTNNTQTSYQRRSLNFDNPKLSVCSEVTINTVPIVTPAIITKKVGVQDTVDSNFCNIICPVCNFQQAECLCRQLDCSKLPVYGVVNKRKNIEDTSGIQDIKRDSSLNEVRHVRKDLSLQNNSSSLIGERLSTPVTITETCDKHRARLSSASPSFTLSQSAPCSPATKPALQKSEAFDVEEYDYYKRLSRGISRATDNVNIVSKARSEIAQCIWDALENGHHSINNTPFFVETPVFTFTLPDLSVYSDEFRCFLEKDLIEMSTLISLEAAGRLNWWAMIGASQRLWPLATTGDGNCLLHAASLGLWGFHDRLLTLRKALHEFLTRSKFSQILYRRWRWQLAMQNKETGLVLSQDEWEAEWESVLRLASSAPRGGSQPLENTTNSAPNLCQTVNSLSQGKLNSELSGPVYESLEEIHVLALAHVLRRPVIVVADTTLKDMNGDPLAPIPFGGIYLPLECPPRECQRSPLLLTYDAAHFSALVVMETSDKDDSSKPPLPAVIPVSDCCHELLPIQFLVDPGEDFVWCRDEMDEYVIQKLTLTTHDRKGLLSEYLDLVQVPIPSAYLETSPGGSQEDSTLDPGDPLLDIDKKSSESSFDSDDGPPFFDGGGNACVKAAKAPKQLQTVVKSFGSLGRSMSKRIKKNFNNLSRFSRSGSFRRKEPLLVKGGFACSKGSKGVRVGTQQSFILAARIHIDERQAYQQEMIENYLTAARERFMRDAPKGSKEFTPTNAVEPSSPATGETLIKYEVMGTQCINPGCGLYGTAQTSYLCTSCFNRQKEQEERAYARQSSEGDFQVDGAPVYAPNTTGGITGSGLQYGTGRSKFYAPLDENSIRSATLLPVSAAVSAQRDRTLFLSNSTFYNDSSLNASSLNASSIPSYNLNRDLSRDIKKTKPTITSSKPPSEASFSSNSRSSSSLSEPLQTNRFGQDCSTLNGPSKEPLAPICIDGMKVDFDKGTTCGNQKNVGGLVRSPKKALNIATTASDTIYSISKQCLTKGCEFYGNAATDYLCSKCHLSKKKLPSGPEAFPLDQVKYVQI